MTTTYEAADAAIFLPTKPADAYIPLDIYAAHADLMEAETVAEGCAAFNKIADVCGRTIINGKEYAKHFGSGARQIHAPVLGDLGLKNTICRGRVTSIHITTKQKGSLHFIFGEKQVCVFNGSLLDSVECEMSKPIMGSLFDVLRHTFDASLKKNTHITPLGALLDIKPDDTVTTANKDDKVKNDV